MAQIVTAEIQLKLGQLLLNDVLVSLSESVSDYAEHSIATGVTDQAVSFGPVTTADIFYVTSNYQVTYKLNGSATAHTLDANGHHLLYGDNVTSMTITNTSGSTATLKKLVAGT